MHHQRLYKLTLSVIVATLACTQPCIAQSPATQPSHPATPPPLTAKEQAIINAANRAPADVAAPRIDITPYNKDGTRNSNFGRPQQWFLAQHEQFLKRREHPVGLLFIGDSITAGWATNGKNVWNDRYARFDAANFGINGSRTDYVLWQIDHGELDGIKPKVIVLMIGTNNYGSSTGQVVSGIKAILNRIHAKLPDTKVLLLGIFPRGPLATDSNHVPDPGRQKLMAINAELAKLDDESHIRYLEIWRQFLKEDGSLPPEIMPDALHPNEKGYVIWADAMQPLLTEMQK
jgi:lysophospholipase L1-like esterase